MVDDGLAIGVQPHCCGVVMRDRPGVLVCVVCSREDVLRTVPAPRSSSARASMEGDPYLELVVTSMRRGVIAAGAG